MRINISREDDDSIGADSEDGGEGVGEDQGDKLHLVIEAPGEGAGQLLWCL